MNNNFKKVPSVPPALSFRLQLAGIGGMTGWIAAVIRATVVVVLSTVALLPVLHQSVAAY